MTAPGSTLLDVLVARLRGAAPSADGLSPPAAILWTDPTCQWSPLVDLLQSRLPELLVLGAYAPERRTGPAIWLRCLVDRSLPEPDIPEDRPAILYLPGVGRQDLRAGDACPPHLRPLVELMYRGTLWLQKGGRDWSLQAFLTSRSVLGLDVAGDEATRAALARALREVAESPLPSLRGRRLEAEDFDRLLSPDMARDLLRWMGHPAGTRDRLDENAWGAFRDQCRDELGFDPETDPAVLAGEKLGEDRGPWGRIWERFAEAPASFPGLPELLRRSRPPGRLARRPEVWPDLNDEKETEVRNALAALVDRPHPDACEAVLRLEEEHGPRRSWVWARLGSSPMAQVLDPLARLARVVRTSLGGNSPEELASVYENRGWQADRAAWEALDAAPTADETLIAGAVHHLMEPWLDQAARRFQEVLGSTPLPGLHERPRVEVPEGGCLLFADGLRYDVATALAERFEGLGYRVALRRSWSAVPSVTATGKPAATPVRDHLVGTRLGGDFAPRVRATGRVADAATLRACLADHEIQVLAAGDPGVPLAETSRGYLEAGRIDELGHKLGARLARQLREEIQRLVEVVGGLFECGWRSVRIVTDHGWLLLPGGLPRVDLPRHLTESRWARCAVLAGSSSSGIPVWSWSWNPAESFASAPGIACFNKSEEYTHGGLSLQECLVPDLLVEPGVVRIRTTAIASITWKRLRCLVEVEGTRAGLVADLRLGSVSGRSVCAAPKPVGEDGSVSLLLARDEHEEDDLVLVVQGDDGSVLAQRSTRVGKDT